MLCYVCRSIKIEDYSIFKLWIFKIYTKYLKMELSKKPEITFNIKKINLVSSWELNLDETNCKLCKRNVHDIPPNKHNNHINSEILVTKGKCGCCYHTSCISGWRKEYDTCPECQIKFVSDGNINNKSKIPKLFK